MRYFWTILAILACGCTGSALPPMGDGGIVGDAGPILHDAGPTDAPLARPDASLCRGQCVGSGTTYSYFPAFHAADGTCAVSTGSPAPCYSRFCDPYRGCCDPTRGCDDAGM